VAVMVVVGGCSQAAAAVVVRRRVQVVMVMAGVTWRNLAELRTFQVQLSCGPHVTTALGNQNLKSEIPPHHHHH
jgi:hypothetical protein